MKDVKGDKVLMGFHVEKRRRRRRRRRRAPFRLVQQGQKGLYFVEDFLNTLHKLPAFFVLKQVNATLPYCTVQYGLPMYSNYFLHS